MGDGRLGRRNSEAWEALYRSTRESVWGLDPLPFVPAMLRRIGAELQPGARALDAGAGEGRHLPALLATGAEVTGVDYSPSALAKVESGLRARVYLARCDLGSLPFADASFDLALSVDVVETLVEPDIVLREMARVLRPGGWLVCNIPGDEDEISGIDMAPVGADAFLFQGSFFYRFLPQAEATRLLEGAGLRVSAVEAWSWSEPPHPNFRDEAHRHTSRVFVAQRAPG